MQPDWSDRPRPCQPVFFVPDVLVMYNPIIHLLGNWEEKGTGAVGFVQDYVQWMGGPHFGLVVHCILGIWNLTS